jgi:hypothetical protein
MWLSCRFSRSLWRYSAASPVSRRLATMRNSLPFSASSRMNRSAVASSSTRSTRSSVVRQTLDMKEVTTMVMMKKEAILIPSGRPRTFCAVV